ncbi:vegetative cell wall protein gp1 (Hydroxyproline-rich glycoprotein 1), partial [Streptomyces himastatinicus ATCC 53653]
MRELAVRVRAASAQGQLAALVGELTGRGAYEERLAAAAAAIGGRTGHLETLLTDPDPLVRCHALRGAGAGARVRDEALEAAFEDAPAAVRRQLIRAVVAQRRTALADRLVDPLRERWGDVEAARLLPACGADTVVRLLPALFHAVGSWRPLTARHPAAVLDEAERQLTALPVALRTDWWLRYAPGVALAARAEPHRVLDLLERCCHSPLPTPLRHRLGTLVAADPGRTVDLLLTPEHAGLLRGRGLERAVLRRLVSADPPELDALGRALAHDAQALARLLAALPPARRAAFFDAATAEHDPSHAVLAPAVLDALPRPRRQAEAHRMATQARERGAHWTTVLEAVAYLPVEEAREELLTATRRPAADDRATAYPLLIRNAARSGDPDAVTALLRQLERLRSEQDPVRHAALDALAATPPALFTDDAAEPLDRVATDAIQARDSSTATRQALRRLAVALLREHAVTGRRELLGWALRTVTRLAGSVGAADLGRLDHQLRRGQEHTVFEALRPWLEAGAERVDHELTFALARSLGRRAHTMPELQELLWQAIAFGRGENRPHRDHPVAGAATRTGRPGGRTPRPGALGRRPAPGPGRPDPAPHRSPRPGARRHPALRPLPHPRHPLDAAHRPRHRPLAAPPAGRRRPPAGQGRRRHRPAATRTRLRDRPRRPARRGHAAGQDVGRRRGCGARRGRARRPVPHP